MANALYDLGRQKFLSGDLDFDAHTIKVALVLSTYTPNLATNEFYDNGGGAVNGNVSARVVGTPQTLATKTVTAGVADADDVTFTTVAGGSTVGFIAIYRDTGTPTTSPLIALIDTATGLPLTTNGGDITIQWDNGSNKIFKL